MNYGGGSGGTRCNKTRFAPLLIRRSVTRYTTDAAETALVGRRGNCQLRTEMNISRTETPVLQH